ncbi:hypothetical protein B0H14DRAFT_551803 [Mycena olivaceomarginata]|nr:hypothetical protein B0H14DRAFT_551803 [Mycena olivaceomarginata]
MIGSMDRMRFDEHARCGVRGETEMPWMISVHLPLCNLRCTHALSVGHRDLCRVTHLRLLWACRGPTIFGYSYLFGGICWLLTTCGWLDGIYVPVLVKRDIEWSSIDNKYNADSIASSGGSQCRTCAVHGSLVRERRQILTQFKSYRFHVALPLCCPTVVLPPKVFWSIYTAQLHGICQVVLTLSVRFVAYMSASPRSRLDPVTCEERVVYSVAYYPRISDR